MSLAITKMADSDSEVGAPSCKKKAISGAATYKTRFNVAWKEELPFVRSVKGCPFK